MKSRIDGYNQKGEGEQLHVAEAGEEVQRGEVEDKTRFIRCLEEEDKNEFNQEINREKYQQTIRNEPGMTMEFFRSSLFFFRGTLFF